jgi:hypothetical protein
VELFTLGIDLGKTTFHLVGMDQRGEVVLRKRFSRVQHRSQQRVKSFHNTSCPLEYSAGTRFVQTLFAGGECD